MRRERPQDVPPGVGALSTLRPTRRPFHVRHALKLGVAVYALVIAVLAALIVYVR